MPDFTFEESDNYMYAEKIEAMTKEEMIEEYKSLLEQGRRGGYSNSCLSMCFDLITTIAGRKDINLDEGLTEKELSSIVILDDLNSRSISKITYDYYQERLCVTFKTNSKEYKFKNIPASLFEELEAADNKREFIAEKIQKKK